MFILSSHKDGRGASSPVPSLLWPRLPSGSTFLHWFSLFWGQIWNAFKTSQLRVWSATLVFCKRHCREEQTRNQTERDFLCTSSWVPISSAPESNFVISSIAALKLRSKFKEETDGGYMEYGVMRRGGVVILSGKLDNYVSFPPSHSLITALLPGQQ